MLSSSFTFLTLGVRYTPRWWERWYWYDNWCWFPVYPTHPHHHPSYDVCFIEDYWSKWVRKVRFVLFTSVNRCGRRTKSSISPRCHCWPVLKHAPQTPIFPFLDETCWQFNFPGACRSGQFHQQMDVTLSDCLMRENDAKSKSKFVHTIILFW